MAYFFEENIFYNSIVPNFKRNIISRHVLVNVFFIDPQKQKN